MMARTSASLLTVVPKAPEPAFAEPAIAESAGAETTIAETGSSRRVFLSRLAGACGLLVLPELLACNRTSFHRRVGVSIPYDAEILNEFYSDMKIESRYLQKPLHLVLVEAQGDFLKQTIDIQLFIAQGFGGVFMFVLPYGMEQVIAQAHAKGVCIFNHSAMPITGCTQNIVLDQHAAGYQVGSYAAQWINQELGGKADVGILANFTDSQLVVRTRGLKDGLQQNCSGVKIVGEVEANTVDAGAAAAANLLQAHPNISAILAFGDDPGVGAYAAALEAGRRDRNRFFVGSADGTRLGMEKVGEGGIYHCCAFFFFSFSATQAVRDLDRCLRGEHVPPTRIMGSKLVTAANVHEFERISHNPRAPEYAHFYSDPAVMRYSDVPLTTPE
jgi:ABC-type sugar transport system substrate-binding protein